MNYGSGDEDEDMKYATIQADTEESERDWEIYHTLSGVVVVAVMPRWLAKLVAPFLGSRFTAGEQRKWHRH